MTGRVVITGAGSGIGRAIGEAFAEAGWQVWISDVSEDSLADIPKDWRATVTDVGDEAAVARLFAEIDGAWGGVDAVCANAGTAGPTAALEDVDLGAFRACTAVTLDGCFLTLKHAAPILKRQGSGAIVVTSSTAGLYGYPNRAPYCAAKWAVLGLMKTAAMELGPFGVRANAICPGAVEGPRMDGVLAREAEAKGMTPEAIRAGYEIGTSMRTWVRAEDVAATALYLCSPASARVSGQIIAVDGHTENPDPKVGPQIS